MYDEVLSMAQLIASGLFLVGIGLIVKPASIQQSPIKAFGKLVR